MVGDVEIFLGDAEGQEKSRVIRWIVTCFKFTNKGETSAVSLVILRKREATIVTVIGIIVADHIFTPVGSDQCELDGLDERAWAILREVQRDSFVAIIREGLGVNNLVNTRVLVHVDATAAERGINPCVEFVDEGDTTDQLGGVCNV